MTLKELFEKHGSVWLAENGYPNEKAFKPLAFSEQKPSQIIGEDDEGLSLDHFIMENSFVLYQPKPKTVKRSIYFYKTEDCPAVIQYSAPKTHEEFYASLGALKIEWYVEAVSAECPE